MNKQTINTVIGNLDLDYVKAFGGFTFKPDSTLTNPELTSGYMVAVSNKQPVTIPADSDSKTVACAILAVLNKLPEITKDIYVGGWIDNGQWYIELSEHIINLDLAIRVGKLKNQKAIFDLNKMQDINLK